MHITFLPFRCYNIMKLICRFILLGIICLTLPMKVVHASVLSDAASALNVGQWVEIQTTNDESVLETDSGEFDILDNYSSQMVYDPASDAVYYAGCSHHPGSGSCDFDCKFIKYDIATNTWSQASGWSGFSTCSSSPTEVTHGYDSNIIDSRRGDYYHVEFKEGSGPPTIRKYGISSQSWSTLSSAPLSGHYVNNGAGYFSTIDKLVVIGAGVSQIAYYDLTNRSWDSVQSTSAPADTYHGQACDLPRYGLFVFGGGNGSNGLYTIDANKTITSIGPPSGLSLNVSNNGGGGTVFLQDPASGDLLLFKEYGGTDKTYSWNPSDGWSDKGISPPMGDGSVDGHAFVALPGYGVIMGVRRSNRDVEVWLYKNSGEVSQVPPGTQNPPPTSTTVATPARLRIFTPASSSPLDLPTIQDEIATYERWGWDWSGAIQPTKITDPYQGTYYVSNPDVHGDTEADDLWTYLQMARRGGNSVYSNRANAWLRYFKEDYRTCNGDQYSDLCYDISSYGGCHLYGYGLILQYQINGDTSALNEAIALGGEVEKLYDPAKTTFSCLPSNACLEYSQRQVGRHLILAARLAEVTGDSRWATLRDKIVNIVLNSPLWDTKYGMYFWGDWQTDKKINSGAYAAGYRTYWPTGIAILAEGFWQVYRTTGNQTVKQRLISIANFISNYGLDPTVQYAGYTAGVDPNGAPYHSGLTDPSYTISLVNILVMGYKLTGNQNLLDKAKIFFNRGTKGVYGSTSQRLAADNQVHHFVDTTFASGTSYFYLDNNRAELFYTYMIFENGGLPKIE